MSKSKSEHKRLVAQGVENDEVEFVESPDMPPVKLKKAFSVDRGPGGWVMIEYHILNDKIIEVKRSEPNLKSFAINDFKKAAFHYWDKEVEL